MLTPSGWLLRPFGEWIGFLITTCIQVLVILRGSLIVTLRSSQLVTVDKKDDKGKLRIALRTIIPSALETKMVETETEAILATVT